jgi:adenylosuccinate synthase
VKPELTTVTKKVRRVFTWSWDQFTQSVIACQPSEVFLNFCNYLEDSEVEERIEKMNQILKTYGPGKAYVAFTGHGPTNKDVIYAG